MTSLCLSFLICEMGIVTVPHRVVVLNELIRKKSFTTMPTFSGCSINVRTPSYPMPAEGLCVPLWFRFLNSSRLSCLQPLKGTLREHASTSLDKLRCLCLGVSVRLGRKG